MTYNADLTETGRVKHIGYLARGHSYTKRTTSETFFDHLVALVERPLGHGPDITITHQIECMSWAWLRHHHSKRE
jgi:hypothetical protein